VGWGWGGGGLEGGVWGVGGALPYPTPKFPSPFLLRYKHEKKGGTLYEKGREKVEKTLRIATDIEKRANRKQCLMRSP